METERMIIEIKKVALKYSNRKINTFDTDITKMCNDVIKKLEVLKMYENTGLTPKEIECLKNNKWIPVSERLPEENWQYVLITVDRWSTIADEWIYDDVKLTLWNKERNEFDYERGCWEDKQPKIKAWMPLPEPYKESD